MAVSGDFVATLNHWSKELGATFPMLSDYKREVMKQYGVLGEKSYLANRTTFLIDTDGKIAYIEESNSTIDPTGVVTACSRLKKQ